MRGRGDDRALRICFFTDTFFPAVGGAEMVLDHLARHLSAMGHQVHILAPRSRRRGNARDPDYPVHRYGEPSSKRFLVRQLLVPLAWTYLRHRFDVLHCHAAFPQAYVGATFKRWFQVPMVVRPHGSDIVPGGRMRKTPRAETRLKRGLSAADAVIAQGRYMKEIIEELGVVAPEAIHTIHNGTDVKRFSRSSAPYPHRCPYILAVGSLIQRKGFDILIRAFKGIASRNIDLLIAGIGREEDNLKALCQQLGLVHRVRFLGMIRGEEKARLYRSAQFLVCSSWKEPFSNVILEALASGLPVAASAVDGNLELIVDGENGRLFPAGDANRLSDILEELTSNHQLRKTLGQGAAESARRFDWPLIAAEYLALYQKVAAASGRIVSSL